MADRVAIITRDEDGIRIAADGVIRHFETTSGLAQSWAALQFENSSAREREHKIRHELNSADKHDGMLAKDLVKAIREILNEGVPF